MADESEKRFHAIMDKLFHTPLKSKSSPPTTPPSSTTPGSTIQFARGKKRPIEESTLSIVSQYSRRDTSDSASDGTVQPPQCRPWDRGDLLKRIATFKSMTWFGKPKVINAVNCARHGWVNVDMDVIACQACGARLIFSVPLSWTHSQVAKASFDFSLKLKSGHKLLCPWVDNACEETLSQFPPMPSAALVDNYKKRCSILLQLSALPIVSSSSIDSIKNDQLEHFLRLPVGVGRDNDSPITSGTESRSDESEAAVTSSLYYQAQKLISLFGWEPRIVPYVVECKDLADQSGKERNYSRASNGSTNRENNDLIVYSLSTNENLEADSSIMASGVESDPSSVVLDCQLCTASVGLWAFSTVPRPIEFLRLVGCSDFDRNDEAAHHKDWASATPAAGGKSGLGHGEGETEVAVAGSLSLNESPSNLQLTIAGGPPPTKQSFRPTISLPVIGRALRAQFSSNFDCMDGVSIRSFSLEPEDQGLSLGETSASDKGISKTSKTDAMTVHQFERCNADLEGSSEKTDSPENMKNGFTVNSTAEENSGCQLQETINTTPDSHAAVDNDKTNVNATAMLGPDKQGTQQFLRTDSISCRKSDNLDGSGEKGKEDVQDDELKQLSPDNAIQFDPIKQHRHFCPWIASNGNSAPGWKQTLNALQRQKEFSCPSSQNASLATNLIEVDDPIASVKRLFMSSSAKKMKIATTSR